VPLPAVTTACQSGLSIAHPSESSEGARLRSVRPAKPRRATIGAEDLPFIQPLSGPTRKGDSGRDIFRARRYRVDGDLLRVDVQAPCYATSCCRSAAVSRGLSRSLSPHRRRRPAARSRARADRLRAARRHLDRQRNDRGENYYPRTDNDCLAGLSCRFRHVENTRRPRRAPGNRILFDRDRHGAAARIRGRRHDSQGIVPSILSVSGADSYAEAARLGLGIAQAPRYRFIPDPEGGQLVELLTDWRLRRWRGELGGLCRYRPLERARNLAANLSIQVTSRGSFSAFPASAPPAPRIYSYRSWPDRSWLLPPRAMTG
jgi:hypothetical protein